jgi:hypothetical protein
MDVKTAFLYGSLEETVYMEQPQGFERGKDMVWKLDRSLYGLKQAPRAWYRTLDSSLKELGFTRTISDHSIYVRGGRDDLIIVGVYVDDLTIAAARLETLEEFKKEMSKRYDMKDLGELHFILGLQVTRDRAKRSLSLCQTQYIDSILTRFNMQGCKPAKSPLRAKTILKPRDAEEEKADLALYLAVVGSLMYAMLGTRPDIAYAVGLLGRFSSDPSREHWMTACGVLMYLKPTRTLGIEFSNGQTELDGFSDADFATSDPSRRRVTSGYCFRLWGGPISWQSKRQPSVSLATGDAEYVALAQAAREAMWLRSLLTELGFTPSRSIKRHRSPSLTTRSVTPERSRSISGSIIFESWSSARSSRSHMSRPLPCWLMGSPSRCPRSRSLALSTCSAFGLVHRIYALTLARNLEWEC